MSVLLVDARCSDAMSAISDGDKWLAGLSKGMCQVQSNGRRSVRQGEKGGRFGWAGTGEGTVMRVGGYR